MAVEARILSRFQGAAEAALDRAAGLSSGIATGAERIVNGLTQGGKVLALGVGGAAFLARHFAALMINQFEADRPGLAAIALAPDIASAAGAGELDYGRQIKSLGLPGDVLLVLDPQGVSRLTARALEAADARGMRGILIAGEISVASAEPIPAHTVNLVIRAESAARVLELQLLALHCLCDAVDSLLLGVD